MPSQPELYHRLSEWWYLLSPIEDYEEESAFYSRILQDHARRPLREVLELGSGGGNNAWFMKKRFVMTLTDVSEQMIGQSRRANPDCEHHVGDMRTVRLAREFDGVFIHDAIDYMTTLDDLRRAMETAYVHCRPGGVALFAPDHVRELFEESTSHGGSDGRDRAIRYLEWTWDPDPNDSVCTTEYVYALRMPDGSVDVEHDRHIHGLFPRQSWLNTMLSVGFEPRIVPLEHSELEPGSHEVFIGLKADS